MTPSNLTIKEILIKDSLWPSDLSKFTPLMRQYLEIKYKYDLEILLLFRVGDFYETFFEDAKIISKELDLTLTGRSEVSYPGGRIPMAGVPAKSVVNYVSKLLDKGYKVAICEQLEDPQLAKSVVKRDVTKLLTPGTVLESDWLPQTKNNFIASVFKDKKEQKYGFAYTDVSCGEFYFTELTFEELLSELNRVSPSEVLVPFVYEKSKELIVKEKILEIDSLIKENWFCTALDKGYFNLDFASKKLKEELNIQSLESLAGGTLILGLIAAASIFEYLNKTQLNEKPTFENIKPYYIGTFLNLDKTTRKNLELTETIREKEFEDSLLWSIDYAKTKMGKRRLRSWLEQPLLDISLINSRLDSIEELINYKNIFHELSIILENISDLERIVSRLSAQAVNARELNALKESLLQIPCVRDLLKNFSGSTFQKIINFPKEILEVVALIERAIIDYPSNVLTEGNLIKSDYNKEVSDLRELINNGHAWIKSFEEIEKQRTGIKNLKVGFNRTFGYYIEISKGNLPLVPKEYICKQTMVNGSRFITEELKQFEQKSLNAHDKLKSLEYELFCNVREQVRNYSSIVREIAYSISNLDALFSLAQAAVINNYKRPLLDNSFTIELKASRHPVIEKKIGFNNFVPNNCYLEGNKEHQLVILTGPNMAGKSTYMRQIALNVILAQIGSFVPCDYAKIGIVDQIFTRVGAADDITEGQSTFMVEMTETSSILNRMTEKSLILLDEVGRGTSTYDGVAIAWALAEYLVKNVKPRTVFATHFHELNGLADLYNSIVNYQVTVKEEGSHVIFLRKVVPGGADRSYGIEVAKMAGLPKELLNRAKNIMETIYSKTKTPVKRETIKSQIESGQLSLFG